MDVIASGWFGRTTAVGVETRWVDGQSRRCGVRIFRPGRRKASQELKVAAPSGLRLETRDALSGTYALVLLFIFLKILELGVVKLAARFPVHAFRTTALVRCISVVDRAGQCRVCPLAGVPSGPYQVSRSAADDMRGIQGIEARTVGVHARGARSTVQRRRRCSRRVRDKLEEVVGPVAQYCCRAAQGMFLNVWMYGERGQQGQAMGLGAGNVCRLRRACCR